MNVYLMVWAAGRTKEVVELPYDSSMCIRGRGNVEGVFLLVDSSLQWIVC